MLLGGVFALLVGCSDARESSGSNIPVAEVSTADVHRFVFAYRRLTTADSNCAALSDFVRAASRGQRAYFDKFEVGLPEICHEVRRVPAEYGALDAKLPGLDSAASLVKDAFARYARLIPEGRTPDVYFVVGNGTSGGTTMTGAHPAILVGVELNGDIPSLTQTIAHEFVHTQQHFPWIGSLTGGPRFLAPLRGSVLRHSIMEGSADFIAELITGVPKHNAYGEAHEAELWTAFQRDLHSKDYSQWLWNGRTEGRVARPADLVYYMGYVITKAYYERASDKHMALREILSIKNFDRFLKQSGYHGPLAASQE